MKYDPIMCMMVDDSVKTEDSSYSDFKEVYNILAEALRNSANTDKMVQLISKAQGKVLELAAKTKDSKTIDHAIRSCDSREDDIADELFDALQQIGKRNINKNEAEFISEKFFDGKVSVDELMRIFNKYKKEYL